MTRNNNKHRIQTRVLRRAAELFLNGSLEEDIDRIPLSLFPRTADSFRCCIYKDRAVTRFRLMALLGIDPAEETDESVPLSRYAAGMLTTKHRPQRFLSIIDIACSSCPSNQVEVGDNCRGCLARHCQSVCPKDALRFEDSKAVIDQERCVSCGKCANMCPYGAISVQKAPCVQACPVKAIEREGDGPAAFRHDNCFLCGSCYTACPFGAIVKLSSVFHILRALQSEKPAVAMIAPSVAGQFPGSVGQCMAALRKLGFDDVIEVALGAEDTIALEAEELADHAEKERGILTTSCCPAFVEFISRNVEELEGHISATPSPMVFTARRVKALYSNAVSVFIGPCIAKNREAERSGEVDYVMTFDELGGLFMAAGILVEEMKEYPGAEACSSSRAKGFAKAGGVGESLQERNPGLSYEQLNGISRKSKGVIRSMMKMNPPSLCLEGMACEGGCINGPGVIAEPRVSTGKLKEYMETG